MEIRMVPIGALMTSKVIGGIILVSTAVVTIAYIGVQKATIKSLRSDIAALTEMKNNLTVDNAILKENNAALKDGLKKLAAANQTNFETARQLLDERGKAMQAITNLAATNRISNQKLDRLSAKLEEMLKDPKNDGPVAPVLREVLREVQRERAK